MTYTTYIADTIAGLLTVVAAGAKSAQIAAMTAEKFRIESGLPAGSTGVKVENFRRWTLEAIEQKIKTLEAEFVAAKLDDETVRDTLGDIAVEPAGDDIIIKKGPG
jgi:hypothetical protein